MPTGQPHPPSTGGIVAPNFLSVEEAVGNVTFPISKRDLLDQVGDATVLLNGRNVDLHDLVRDLNDDFFESEEAFHDALEIEYGATVMSEPEPLPTGPMESEQSRTGEGATGSPSDYFMKNPNKEE